MSKPLRTVVLLTDFGLSDPFVGLIKGVMLCHHPGLCLLDLTHGIPPQQILIGAMLLASSWRWLPDDSVFLCVVDPGVGSARHPVVRRAAGRLFVGPDNGLLSLLDHPPDLWRRIDPSAIPGLSPPRSRTFHGRDIFAPVAARLATGALSFDQVGPILPDPVQLTLPVPVATLDGGLDGEVLYLDRYGNAILSLPAVETGSVSVSSVSVSSVSVSSVSAAPGLPLALTGSTGHLELSVRDGSAADRFDLHPGSRVRWHP